MPLERGSLLNKRYRIMDILGQGGMAAIYRAVDENLGVEVAVKENLFTTDDYARQFRYEAVILATLRHPNLPRVTDHFVIEGQGQYLVMDYIEGEDLRQRMDRMGVLTEAEAIILGVAICDALTYLHTRNPCILHRDIKPGNVKITPQGQVFLVDFGLAKVVRAGEATETGARAMTPGYSPPEQYGTARTDTRSDVYSLGATLYSALANCLPEDALARAMDQARLTPVGKHNPKISRRLESVLEKSLAVKPEDRYQSAEEFRQALLNSRNTSQRGTPLELVLSPPPYRNGFDRRPIRAESLDDESDDYDSQQLGNVQAARRRSRPVGWLGLIVVGLLLAIGTGAYWLNPDWPAQFLAYMMPPYTSSPSPQPSGTPKPVTQAPVAFLKSESPTPTGTGTPTALPSRTDPPPTLTPTITLTPIPTRIGGGYGQIAFSSDRTGMFEIWLINLDGTGLRKLTSINEGACQPSWSPDGKRLVFISPCGRETDTYRGSSLFLINADGSNLQPLPSVPGGDFDPSWSPDGTRIAFTSLRGGEHKGIFILDLDGNTVVELKDPDGREASEPAWSPDSLQIAYAGPRNQIWAMAADGSDRHVLTRNAGENKKGQPTWSPDAKAVIYTEWEEGLGGVPWLAAVAISSNTSPSLFVLRRGIPMSKAAYSPDGYWLVYQSWPATQYRHIFLMMPNGVNLQQLTDGQSNDIDPAWRPVTTLP